MVVHLVSVLPLFSFGAGLMSILFPRIESFTPKLTLQTIKHQGECLNLYQHVEADHHVLSIKNPNWEDFWWCRDLFSLTIKEPDFVVDLRTLSPRQYRWELYSMFNVQMPTVDNVQRQCQGLLVQAEDTLDIYSAQLSDPKTPLFSGVLAESREGVLHVCEWYTTTRNLNCEA